MSYGHSTTLADYLRLLGEVCGRDVRTVRMPRGVLESEGLLPHCSPFSGKWMSELDNAVSLAAFDGMLMYTAPEAYLSSIFENYEAEWIANGSTPSGYLQRRREMEAAFGYGLISARE